MPPGWMVMPGKECTHPEGASWVSYPRIIPRSEHSLSRNEVWPEALKVIRRLSNFGYTAYLVGGGVRDLLLGRRPKDFDVATDATPEEVRKLFGNSRIIGRRFRLVHVYFKGGRIVEVSTFRRAPEPHELESMEDTRMANNFFGSPHQDVMRRDFTINALFYNPGDFTVIDYVGGWDDLRRRVIRSIGEPRARFAEDPVRMTRAVEFASRLGFTLHSQVEEAIREEGWRISRTSPERLKEEVLGILLSGASGRAVKLMAELGLFQHLFPHSSEVILPYLQDVVNLLVKADGSLNREAPYAPAQFLSLLFLPRIKAAKPFGGRVTLGEVMEEVFVVTEFLREDLPLPAHLLHSTRELLLGLWRVVKGPRARGARRFRERNYFRAALDLFKVDTLAFKEDRSLLEPWMEEVRRRRKPPYRNHPRRR